MQPWSTSSSLICQTPWRITDSLCRWSLQIIIVVQKHQPCIYGNCNSTETAPAWYWKVHIYSGNKKQGIWSKDSIVFVWYLVSIWARHLGLYSSNQTFAETSASGSILSSRSCVRGSSLSGSSLSDWSFSSFAVPFLFNSSCSFCIAILLGTRTKYIFLSAKFLLSSVASWSMTTNLKLATRWF